MSDIGMGYGEMQVANLCKGYGIGPLHKEVIKDCSFTLEKSKLTVLIGPSGCGKSALINMLAGYETPDAKQSPAPDPTVGSCFRRPRCSRG